MRALFTIVMSFAVIGCGQKQSNPTAVSHSHAPSDKKLDSHGEGDHAGHKAVLSNINLQTREGLKAGAASQLRFTIPDAQGKPIKTFAVSHDAKVHFILIRNGLDQFAHLHPNLDPATGTLTTDYTFPVGGIYHLFADYQESGQMMMTATARVEVAGDAPVATELTPDVPGLLKGNGIEAKVSIEGAKPGVEAKVRFEVLDGGTPVTDLEPYMGAMGHLVVVSADAKQYVHAHPMEKAEAKNIVTFGATFPAAGVYKGWGQFKRGGHVRIVPFVVKID